MFYWWPVAKLEDRAFLMRFFWVRLIKTVGLGRAKRCLFMCNGLDDKYNFYAVPWIPVGHDGH